jgi:hypothetical protein
MRYPDDIASEAAFYGRLQLLQWLRERRCPWEDTKVLCNAAASGSVEMLTWLQSVTAPWADDLQGELLIEAAVNDELDAAKWLKETVKAPWPDDLCATTVVEDLLLSKRVASWILATADCCWDNWDCKGFSSGAAHH